MWHIVRQYHLLELNSFLVHNLRVVGDQAGHGGSDHDVLTPAFQTLMDEPGTTFEQTKAWLV